MSGGSEGWARLLPELVALVFAKLDVDSLAVCMRVCQRWRNVARGVDRLWLAALRQSWVDVRPHHRPRDALWRDLAARRRSFERNWMRGALRIEHRLVHQQPAGAGVVDFVRCGADGRRVVACGLSRSLCFTDLPPAEADADEHVPQTVLVPAHDHFCSSVEALDDAGQRVACASYDGTISVWDTLAINRTALLRGHSSYVLQCKRWGAHLVSRSRDGTLRLWDVEHAQATATLRGHTQSVTAMKIIDPWLIGSCGREGAVLVHDVREKMSVVRQIDQPHTCDAYDICLAGPTTIGSCSADSHLALWDWAAGRTQRLRSPQVGHCIARLSSGRLVAGGNGGALLVHDGAAVVACPAPSDWVVSSCRVVGEWVVTGALDGCVAVWRSTPDKDAPFVVAHDGLVRHSGVVRRLRANRFALETCGYDGVIVLGSFDGNSLDDSALERRRGCSVQ